MNPSVQIRRVASLGLSLASMLAASCSQGPIECASSDAAAPVIEILKQNVEQQVTEQIREGGHTGIVPRAKIRAALGQLNFLIEDVRTSKQDPNSTKRFCSATFRVRFPVELINDAEAARSQAKLGSLTQLADENDIERRADSFSSEMEFNIQPTDDGGKVFAETETGTTMLDFVSEVLMSSLMRSSLEQGARQAQQAMADQAGANLESAKIDNQLAAQSILAVWRALPSSTRSQYLAAQQAWSRKKDADCRVEAAGTSTDPGQIEVARLNCDTRVTQERIDWLEQMRQNSPAAAELPEPGSQPDPETAGTDDL